MTAAKIPKPKDADGEQGDTGDEEPPLPQTLVRIPIQQAEKAQRDQEAAAATTGE